MKKLMAVLLAVLMLSSFATVANAQTVYLLGDVDKSGDEVLNGSDLTYLRKVLLGTETDLGMSDVNEDKDVNIIDLVCLKKLISNPSDGIVISAGDYTEITDNWS